MISVGAFLFVDPESISHGMSPQGATFRLLDRYRTTVVVEDVGRALPLLRKPTPWTAIILAVPPSNDARSQVEVLRARRPHIPLAILGQLLHRPSLAGAGTQRALLDFVRAALVRELCPEPAISECVIAFAAARGLTPREAELLAATAYGVDREQLMDELGLSYNTGKRHVRALLSKLGEPTLERAAIQMLREIVFQREDLKAPVS